MTANYDLIVIGGGGVATAALSVRRQGSLDRRARNAYDLYQRRLRA